jgi:hypothetical protein
MASEPTLDFFDTVNVYDRGPMNPQEIKRIQSAFKARKRLAKFVFANTNVQARAIPLGSDPVDIPRLHKVDPPVLGDCDALRTSLPCLDLLQAGHNTTYFVAIEICFDAFPGTIESAFEALFAKWLEQVVDRVCIERTKRVAVVGGHKNSNRHSVGTERPHNLKTVHLGHLHIEEDKIGPLRQNGGNCRLSIPAFPNPFHIGVGFQESTNAATGQRLIVDYQSAHRHLTTSWVVKGPADANCRTGMDSLTQTPFGSSSQSSSEGPLP